MLRKVWGSSGFGGDYAFSERCQMIEIPDFDSDFIKEWEYKYYACGEDHKDEEQYQRIISEVQKDIAGKGTISKETLKRILKWKDSRERVHKQVEWERYNTIYAPRFRLIISESISDNHKLLILIWGEDRLKDTLPVASGILDTIHSKAAGFGVPVASTVLHFVFPNKFPIIDIRTIETLYFVGRIKSTNKSDYRTYDRFRSVILDEIRRKTDCSLHEIDRALFAYHRDILQHKIDETFKTWIAVNKLGPELSLTLDAPPRLRQIVIDAIRKNPK